MSGAEFHKYAGRGAYHWEALARSVRRHNPYLAGRYELTLRLLAKTGLAGGRVLDIGCGDGALSYLLARAGWRVTGLDYSGTGLGLARAKFSENGAAASFARGDSCLLPVRPGSFDAVVAADIIEHLTGPDAMLAEIHRALKDGGAAVVTTPLKQGPVPQDSEHVREFDEGEFREMLEGRFTSVEVVKSHPAPLFERYRREYRLFGSVGRIRPYRYLYNAMSSYMGRNPFLGPDAKGRYTQLSALAWKKR